MNDITWNVCCGKFSFKHKKLKTEKRNVILSDSDNILSYYMLCTYVIFINFIYD